MIYKNIRGKGLENVPITQSELRQLVFWANIGVKQSRGGQYQRTIKATIKEYAKKVGFKHYIQADFRPQKNKTSP